MAANSAAKTDRATPDCRTSAGLSAKAIRRDAARVLATMCPCLALLGCAAQPGRHGPRNSDGAVRLETGPAERDRSNPVSEGHALTFSSATGERFAARVYNPIDHSPSGLGVLLIGGGLGNDLAWTVPGRVTVPGGSQQVTISGEGDADAPRIAHALARRGHVVMHWSTIAEDDPFASEYPVRMTPRSPGDLLTLTRVALAAFREHGGFDPDRVVLLGHSMGGQRAAAVARDDPGIRALVLLASAQATWGGPGDRGNNIHRAAAREFIATHDSNRDGVIGRSEFDAQSLAALTFDDIDFDNDGAVRAWELSGAYARLARATANEPRPPADAAGIAWTEDALLDTSRTRVLPTLFVYGDLDDAQAHHAPVLAGLINNGPLTAAEVRFVPGVGHTLGPEQSGLVGPIDARVLEVVGNWVDALR